MLENIWFIAAVWMGLALIGSLISIQTGISVALIEILVGVVAGNLAVGLEGGTLHVSFAGAGTNAGHLHHVLQSTEWTNFLALLGSGVLTFLAGAEIDPISLKANWRASVLIGVLSFAIPFAVVWLFAQFVFGWPLHQAQIAGIALSTTSVAVVYAVMIEGGFSDTAMGKMILAACFITDFGTVLALGTLFANYNLRLLLFIIVTLVVLWYMPRWTQSIITRLGATQVSEPEVKFIFFVLFFLGGLATTAKSEGQKRSRSARLPPWSSRCRCISARQNAGSSHAQHRVCCLHAVLFYQSRPVRLAAGALDWAVRDQRLSGLEDGDENRRRVSACSIALHEGQGSELHHAAHGYGPDVRNDFRSLRSAKRDHRPESVHNSCQRGYLERVCADAHRAEIFPTDRRDDARVGTSLSQAHAGVNRRGRWGKWRCQK